MTGFSQKALCPDTTMAEVLATLRHDKKAGAIVLEQLISDYPNDARVHFLYGSILAGMQRYEEGRAAMQQAIVIAPDYTLARFQLGFLELSSGLAAEALATWVPLDELDAENPFRVLSQGLACLIRDDFMGAIALIHQGMALNVEHPLINGDMQLILDEIDRKRLANPEAADEEGSEPASATHQLLQHFALKDALNRKLH